MVKQVEGAGAVELKGSCHTPGLGLKAGGVSTRKFEYTLIQDETLRETTLSVQVEGETYLLEESTESPMYRYNVLIGTKDMMKKPYESYQPGKEAT